MLSLASHAEKPSDGATSNLHGVLRRQTMHLILCGCTTLIGEQLDDDARATRPFRIFAPLELLCKLQERWLGQPDRLPCECSCFGLLLAPHRRIRRKLRWAPVWLQELRTVTAGRNADASKASDACCRHADRCGHFWCAPSNLGFRAQGAQAMLQASRALGGLCRAYSRMCHHMKAVLDQPFDAILRQQVIVGSCGLLAGYF